MNRWEQARAGTGQAVLAERRARDGKVAGCCARMRERVASGRLAAPCDGSRPMARSTRRTPRFIRSSICCSTRSHRSRGSSSLEQLDDAAPNGFGLGEALPLFASLLDMPAFDRGRPCRRCRRNGSARRRSKRWWRCCWRCRSASRSCCWSRISTGSIATSLAWLERLIDQTVHRAAASGDDDAAQHAGGPLGTRAQRDADCARGAHQRRDGAADSCFDRRADAPSAGAAAHRCRRPTACRCSSRS